jgi:hypothetical protein
VTCPIVTLGILGTESNSVSVSETEACDMSDKILGVVLLGLSAASQVFIDHEDTALFYSWFLGVIGVYELVLGDIRQRKSR